VSGPVRRGLVSVVIRSATSAYCRELVGEVGLVSGLYCEVGVVSGRFRRVRLSGRDVLGEVGFLSVRVRRSRLSVGTCPARSAKCRDVFGDVGFFLDLSMSG